MPTNVGQFGLPLSGVNPPRRRTGINSNSPRMYRPRTPRRRFIDTRDRAPVIRQALVSPLSPTRIFTQRF